MARLWRALLVPADPSTPVERITLDSCEDLTRLLGGAPESTRYDRDALMFVHDTGRLDGLPLNGRATHYLKTASEAALNRAGIPGDSGFPDDYGLYGEVVITGRDVGYDIPARLVEWFEVNEGTGWSPPPGLLPS